MDNICNKKSLDNPMQAYGEAREDLIDWDFPSSAHLLSNISGIDLSEGGFDTSWLPQGPNQDMTGVQPPASTLPPSEQNHARNEGMVPWSVQSLLQDPPPSLPSGSPLSAITNSPWSMFPDLQPPPTGASGESIGALLSNHSWLLDPSLAHASITGTETYTIPGPHVYSVPSNQAVNPSNLSRIGPVELGFCVPAHWVPLPALDGLAAGSNWIGDPLASTPAAIAPRAFVLQPPLPECSPNCIAESPIVPTSPDRFLDTDGRFTQRDPVPSLQIKFDWRCDPAVNLGCGSSPSTTIVGSTGSSPSALTQQSRSPSTPPFDLFADPESPTEPRSGKARPRKLLNVKNPGCRCGKIFKDERQHWRSCRSNPKRLQSQCPHCLRSFPGKNHSGNLTRHLEESKCKANRRGQH